MGTCVYRKKGVLVENSNGRQTSSEVQARWGRVSTWMGDHLQTEAIVLIFILNQIFLATIIFAGIKT